MRLLLIATLLTGCFQGSSEIPAWDAATDPACEGNSAPVVGNVENDSFCLNENDEPCSFPPEDENGEPDPPWDWVPDAVQTWTLDIRFSFRDPGEEGAGDPPNMVGGLANGEVDGHSIGSAWFVDVTDYLPPSEPTNTAIPIDPDSETGSVGVEPLSMKGWGQGSPVRMAFRVYDRCDRVSNEAEVEYLIGYGYWIDGEPVEEP